MAEDSAPTAPSRASSSSRVHQKRQKACDACHRRKIRCNGEEGGPNPCSYCVKNGYECTYNHRPNKWPPSKTYVDGLEVRVAELERRVQYLKRELDKARNMPTEPDLDTSDDDTSEGWSVRRPAQQEDPATEAALKALTDGYEDLWLGNPTGMRVSQEPRMFHGKTSHFQVVNQHLAEVGSKTFNKGKFFQLRIRPEFRMVDPDIFDMVNLHHEPPAWPEPDLAITLINVFFEKWNNVMPLLHKPTFMRQYGDPMMRMDNDWVSVAFGVFALAAKHVDDPRALGEPDKSGHYFDAGMKYWKEMRRVGSPLYAAPSLFRLQALILFTYFLGGGPIFPSAGWALIGTGLRYVQDAGMHLKNEWLERSKAHPFEYEMRKRIFWVLYMVERTMALEMDRSFCIPEEDYDVDLLLELDDAALDQLQQGQTNPAGFSHSIAAFNARIRLLQLASRYRNEIYAMRRMANTHEIRRREVNYLHSSRMRVNNHKTNLHKDLIYSPDQPNNERFFYSALIHIQFAWVQLIMYRPFFSKAKRAAHPDFPAMAISTAAANEVALALDRLRERTMLRGRIHETGLAAFVAGSVILMDMWEQKTLDDMARVEMCLKALGSLEDRWQFPGLLHDVLRNFATVTEKVITGHCPMQGYKPTKELAALSPPHKCPEKNGCTNGSTPDDSCPRAESESQTSTVVATIAPPNGVDIVDTVSTSMTSAGDYPTFFLGNQEPYTQAFANGAHSDALPHGNGDITIPLAPPTNQPMFGEDGWLNDLNFGSYGFMDPQFSEWLNSMLLASDDTFTVDPAASAGTTTQSLFSSTNGNMSTAVNGNSAWSAPWSFDGMPN